MEKTYKEICKELGFSAESHFVEIVDGAISFTAGKPDEIKQLIGKACACGYDIDAKAMQAYVAEVGRVPQYYKKIGKKYVPQSIPDYAFEV